MKGLLIIKLIEARGLIKGKGLTRLSHYRAIDPYFSFTIGHQHALSEVKPNSPNPCYDETFDFIVDTSSSDTVLLIEAFSQDILTKDSFLGSCSVDAAKLKKNELYGEWYALQECESGEVCLNITYISLDTSDNYRRDAFGFLFDPSVSILVLAPELTPKLNLRKSFDIHRMSGTEISKRGVPFPHKAECWLSLSGAKQKRHTNPGYYKKLLDNHTPTATCEVFSQIEKDLVRTFAGHPYFEIGNKGMKALKRILWAYAQHNPKLGYCQAMNFVGGFLLLFAEEEDVFWLLLVIVENILPNYYDSNMEGLQVDSKILEHYVMKYFPEVTVLLHELNVNIMMVSMQWFLCIFIDILPTQTTLRLFDSLLCCAGRDVLIQASLNIIKLNAPQIMQATNSSAVYEMLNDAPTKIYFWKFFFQEIDNEFSPLMDIEEIRESFRKEIEESIERRKQDLVDKKKRYIGNDVSSMKSSELLEGNGDKRASALTKEMYEKMMEEYFGDELIFSTQIFKAYDKSGLGTIDLCEFSVGLAILTKGTVEEKIALCFSLFDTNGDGFIEHEELIKILESQYKMLSHRGESTSFVRNFIEYSLKQFDKNKDGRYSLAEFQEVIETQPLIVKFLRIVD